MRQLNTDETFQTAGGQWISNQDCESICIYEQNTLVETNYTCLFKHELLANGWSGEYKIWLPATEQEAMRYDPQYFIAQKRTLQKICDHVKQI